MAWLAIPDDRFISVFTERENERESMTEKAKGVFPNNQMKCNSRRVGELRLFHLHSAKLIDSSVGRGRERAVRLERTTKL